MDNGRWNMGVRGFPIEFVLKNIHSIILTFRCSLILTLVILLFLSFSINAQPDQNDKPAASNGKIKFYVDHAGFSGKDNKTYEEFYLMIYADQLHPVIVNNKMINVFNVHTEIKDDFGSIVTRKNWKTEALVRKDSINFKDLAIYDQWAEELKEGNYNVSVVVADTTDGDQGRADFTLQIKKQNNENFSSSQIEFVSGFNNDISNKQFVKGNHSIIPNPSRRYGILNPLLYIYYELYQIPDTSSGELFINYSIKNMDGKVVKALPVMEIKKSGSNTSLLHGINVSSLPTGVYNFEGTVSDTPSNKRIHFSRQFEIIQMDYLNSQSRFTDEQAQTAANYLKYIVSPEQYKMYESLNLTGKAQFLVQFWKDNDPTPGTPENEYLEKIKQRYNYANNHFRWGKEKGWASDRGRVLIKYGNPDDVERHLLEPDTDPYEIWYYHTEKNYEFVFADLKGDGQFALIHSTKEGEVSNPNWQELVNK